MYCTVRYSTPYPYILHQHRHQHIAWDTPSALGSSTLFVKHKEHTTSGRTSKLPINPILSVPRNSSEAGIKIEIWATKVLLFQTVSESLIWKCHPVGATTCTSIYHPDSLPYGTVHEGKLAGHFHVTVDDIQHILSWSEQLFSFGSNSTRKHIVLCYSNSFPGSQFQSGPYSVRTYASR
jgi:hypothetical protein